MNTFLKVDVEAIVEIEVARLQVDLMARQDELQSQEEIWSRKLRTSQEAVLADLEKSDFKIEDSQTAIHRARETIMKAKAILEARLEEFSKRREELVLQQRQLEQEGIVRLRRSKNPINSSLNSLLFLKMTCVTKLYIPYKRLDDKLLAKLRIN